MNSWLFTTNQTLASLGPSLANHLWQSTAFALAAWLLTLALRGNHARVRHALWIAASIKFLVPFSLLIAAGNLLPHPRHAVAPVVYSAMDVVEEPFAIALPPPAPPQVHVPTLRERAQAVAPAALAALWLAGAAIVLFGWWNRWRIVSSALRAASPATEGRELALLRRVEANLRSSTFAFARHSGPRRAARASRISVFAFASEIGRDFSPGTTSAISTGALAPEGNLHFAWRTHRTRHPLPLLLSSERIEPGIFGVLRPVLVWPAHLSARLDDEHVEAILAHELAHVRRHDNLTALLHMLVEAAFWFHPLVWWMERQIVKEREQACDEAVVALAAEGQLGEGHVADSHVAKSQTGDAGAFTPIDRQTYAEIYAEALLQTCRFCIESPLACVAGVTGADLRRRVADIVTGRALLRMSWPKKLLLAAAAVSVIAAPIVLGQAKAAQRLMLAAINAAPKPLQTAAHAMISEEQTLSTGEIAEARSPQELPAREQLRFDVVSVRPAAPNQQPGPGPRRVPLLFTDDGLSIRNTSLDRLLAIAYELEPTPNRVVGAPGWAVTENWDVEAKVADSDVDAFSRIAHDNTPEGKHQRNLMLQELLAGRFRLKIHMETRLGTTYSLVVAKGGVRASPPKPEDPDAKSHVAFIAGNGHLELPNAEIGSLALLLAREVGTSVVDKTGLTDRYDIKLDWTPDNASGDPSGKPFLTTALEEQLGLKLVQSKGPVPVLVIDHIEKPTVDGAEVAPARGTEAAVRKNIADIQAGTPDYDQMSPELAKATRQQLSGLRMFLAQMGAVKSVQFQTVDPNGADLYHVESEHGATEWQIALGSDGKVRLLYVHPAQSGQSMETIGTMFSSHVQRQCGGGAMTVGEGGPPGSTGWRTGDYIASTLRLRNGAGLLFGPDNNVIKEGDYTLFFTHPVNQRWILIISKKTGPWGMPYPGEQYDIGREGMGSDIAPSIQDFEVGCVDAVDTGGPTFLWIHSGDHVGYAKGFIPNVARWMAAVAQEKAPVPVNAKPSAFEAVTIKPSNNGSGYVAWGVSPTGYSASNVPLARVILDAYLVAPYPTDVRPPLDRLKGAPGWVTSAPYDITAKADEMTIEAMKEMNRSQQIAMVVPMLRAMLEDRFKLVAHTESTEVQGYALVVGKHGIKMKEAQPGEPMPANAMGFGGTWKTVGRRTPDGRQSGTAYLQITMAELTDFLGHGMTPVVDQTGLTGRYDVELPLIDTGSSGSADSSASTPRPDIAHMFDWEAAGLEMKPTKLPVVSVVIDRIERPTPN